MTTISTSQQVEETRAEKTAARRVGRPYVHPYLGGILLGLVLFATFFLTGNGLGASGGMNRFVVWFEDIFAPGHVDRTAYLTSMAGGSTNPFDSWVVFVFVGLFVGGILSGQVFGRSQFKTESGPRTPARALAVRFSGRVDHGLWRADGARLHQRPGAVWRRGAVGR